MWGGAGRGLVFSLPVIRMRSWYYLSCSKRRHNCALFLLRGARSQVGTEPALQSV